MKERKGKLILGMAGPLRGFQDISPPLTIPLTHTCVTSPGSALEDHISTPE